MYSIAVPGLFHYKSLAAELRSDQYFRSIYFSYKIGSGLGLSASQARNLPVKEHLVALHLRLLGDWRINSVMPIYHSIWDITLQKAYDVSDTNMFLLHGASLGTMRRCSRSGTRLIGEAVNIHPKELDVLLESEYRALGLEYHHSKLLSVRQQQEIELCDTIVCPSNAVRESYIRSGYPASQIVVLPYGVRTVECRDNGTLHPRAGRSKALPYKLLFVGQISPRKGLHHLLSNLKKAQDSIGRPSFALTVIGTGSKEYLRILRGIGYPFTYIKHMEHSRLVAEMRKFDGLILPSVEDGFGMVAAEALGAGIDVAVSKFAGISEYISAKYPSHVFDPFNAESFQSALRALLESAPGMCVDLKTWKSFAQQLSQVLR